MRVRGILRSRGGKVSFEQVRRKEEEEEEEEDVVAFPVFHTPRAGFLLERYLTEYYKVILLSE